MSDEPREATLDDVWAAMEAALPPCWWFDRLYQDGFTVQETSGVHARINYWYAEAMGPHGNNARGTGATPTAALAYLVEALKGVATVIERKGT